MATPILFATKDNAEGQLASGINNSVLSIPLGAGEGAEFPQPLNGTASSTGSGTTLNDTGDLASVAQYEFIRNVTDGSWAVVLVTGTNSITTSRLRGGSDNTWQSGDVWRVREFIGFLEEVTADVVTKREKVLVIARSTDTLTVATGGRGYDSSTAQSFSTSDYFRLHVSSKSTEEMIKAILDLDIAENTLNTSMTTAQTDIDNIESGVSFYVAATGSANAFAATYSPVPAYAAGLRLTFKANHTVSGTTTLNVNGLGAKTIKKLDGATNLVSGDIVNGQIVEVEYDGTNFQMVSPLGQASASTDYMKVLFSSGTASGTLANPTSETNFDTYTYTIPANDLVAGVKYEFDIVGSLLWGAGIVTLGVRLGAAGTDVFSTAVTPTANSGHFQFKGFIMGTAAAGAAAAVKGGGTVTHSSGVNSKVGFGINTTANTYATNGTLAIVFSAIYSSSNGTNAIYIDSGAIARSFTTAS